MPSPFPGMNPYFESDEFAGFHTQYVVQLQRDLARRLPPGYRARVEGQVIIREAGASERAVRRQSDVDVTHPPTSRRSSSAAVEAPAYVALPEATYEETHHWLEVLTRRGDRVVTHVEVLSPSNKTTDLAAYIDKRERLLRSQANLIEIDLLRGGGRLPMSGLPPCDYYAMVAQPAHERRGAVWPIALRDRLPTIPVPLLTGDAPVSLDLQAALHSVYDEADYAASLYDLVEPDPPLSPEDAAWAEALLASANSSR